MSNRAFSRNSIFNKLATLLSICSILNVGVLVTPAVGGTGPSCARAAGTNRMPQQSDSRPAQADMPAQQAWKDKSLSPDKRADLVIEQMTLDEKIQLVHGS